MMMPVVATTTAYRVYDSEGEHRYTVYSQTEAEAIVAQHVGWRWEAVEIKSPRW